jgi:hypothetical protein
MFKEAAVLEAAFALCRKLAVDPGRYDTIISDEASGRLISLVVKKVLDGLRLKENLPPLELKFLIGGAITAEQEQAVRDFVAANADQLERSLIVTEFISSGRGVKRMMNVFAFWGLFPDIAAVSIAKDLSDYRQSLTDKLIFGTIGRTGLKMYDAKAQTGVTKVMAPGPHPEKYVDRVPSEDRSEVQAGINLARKEVALVAETFLRLLERPQA